MGRPPCKPVSVPVLRRVAAIHLERPLPNASSDLPGARARRATALPPIWSCSAWGLPCRPGCPRRGALLPHHFTLTSAAEAVSFLWHLPSTPPREGVSRPLAGTPPCGDRTFLPARRRGGCPGDRPNLDYTRSLAAGSELDSLSAAAPPWPARGSPRSQALPWRFGSCVGLAGLSSSMQLRLRPAASIRRVRRCRKVLR